MGHVLVGNTATCTHDITYQYTCQFCGGAVGPLVRQFTHNVEHPMAGAHDVVEEPDATVMVRLAQLHLVDELASVYRRTTSYSRDAYPVLIFENHCPLCRKFQNWDTVRGLFHTKRPANRSEWLLPVVDWRLEQMAENMASLFLLICEDERKAGDAMISACFALLCVDMSACLVPLVMGPTAFEVKPFGARHAGAPDLRQGESALGYNVKLEMHWVVQKDGRVLKIT